MLKIFVFIDIWFVKQNIEKWLKKQRYAVFYGEFENEQKKDKSFLTFRSRVSNHRFSVIFPLMIWIFMEGRVTYEIKSKKASKREDFRGTRQ